MKILLFTDIHWGHSNNSDMHNAYCKKTIDAIIDKVKTDDDIEKVIFAGDWFDTRTTINVKTMNLAARSLNELASALKEHHVDLIMIVGNHDCYSRNSREFHSLIGYVDIPNVTLISEPAIIDDDIGVSPYLFGDENTSIEKLFSGCKYLIGHFEIDGFTKGEHIQQSYMFKHFDKVLSGHFHNHSTKGNITYIGNPFQFDFGERNDINKGYYLWDSDTNIGTRVPLTQGFPLYIQGSYDEVIKVAEQNKDRHLHLQIIVERGTDAIKIKELINKMDLPVHRIKITAVDDVTNENEFEILENVTNIEDIARTFITESEGINQYGQIDRNLLTTLFDDIMKEINNG